MNEKWKIKGLAGVCALACLAGQVPAQEPVVGNVAPATATVAAVKPAARVNDEDIPMTELEALLKQAGPSAMPMPEEQQRAAQRQALAVLIDDVLMHQFLQKSTTPLTDDDVKKKLSEMDTELKKQGKSLAEFYRDSGQTEAQLRTNIGYTMRWQAYAKQHVTDAMVEKYYTDYKDVFDEVTVKASHIVLRVPPTATPAELQSAREKLADLRKQIIDGKIDFAEAAKKHSQCPSAPNGGDIGFFPRKWVVEEPFAKAAFALKVGEISDVVQTDYGLHLIKVTDRKSGQPSDLNKIREEVREACTEEMRQSLLAQMRKDAKIEVNLR